MNASWCLRLMFARQTTPISNALAKAGPLIPLRRLAATTHTPDAPRPSSKNEAKANQDSSDSTATCARLSTCDEPSIYPDSQASNRPLQARVPLYNHARFGVGFSSSTSSTDNPKLPSTQTIFLKDATDDSVLKGLYRRLGTAAENYDAGGAIAVCTEIRKYKEAQQSNGNKVIDFEPREKAVFLALLRAVSHHGLFKATHAIHADMIECGFQDCIHSLNFLLKAAVASADVQAANDTLDRIAQLPNSNPLQVSLTSSQLSDMLFNLSSSHQDLAQSVFQLPTQHTRNWNSTTCDHLIELACQTHNFEYGLVIMSTCHQLGEALSHQSLVKLIGLCLHVSEFRTAVELADIIEQGGLTHVSRDVSSQSAISLLEDASPQATGRTARRLPATVWLSILRACAEGGYLPGVELAWQRAVVRGLLQPDEGTIIKIMAIAAKEGSTQLAKMCLKHLDDTFDPENLSFVSEKTAVPLPKSRPAPGRRLALQEWHFASLYEAQCTNRDFLAAMNTLRSYEHRGFHLSSSTAKRISTSIYPNMDHLSKATQALFQLGLDASKGTHIEVVNAVIDAAVWLGARDQALDIYGRIKTLHAVAGKDGKRPQEPYSYIRPNVATYNSLLNLCIDNVDVELGKQMLQDLNTEQRQPDVVTYERMIVLCLTQPTYEDAFRFIEEAKAKQLVPTRKTYETLIRKCFVSKDIRWKRALSEMEYQGYVPSPRLLNFTEEHLAIDSLEDNPGPHFDERPPQGSYASASGRNEDCG